MRVSCSGAHVASHPTAGRCAGRVTARRACDVGADSQALHAISLRASTRQDATRGFDDKREGGAWNVSVDEIMVAADAADREAGAVGEQPNDV